MMSNATAKRISLKRIRPNPLFQEWLEELYDEAKEKKSNLESMLKEALDSITKYPLPLQSGAECIILKGFDKKLCTHLDKRLEVYIYNANLLEIQSSGSSQSCISNNSYSPVKKKNLVTNKECTTIEYNSASTNSDFDCLPPIHDSDLNSGGSPQYTISSNPCTTSEICGPLVNSVMKKPQSKKYKPVHRSGGYAILLALYEASKEQPSETSLTKEKIIERAQKHCEESFLRPKAGSYYTTWSNMSTLLLKGLVTNTKHKKVEYSLTSEGQKLAEVLLQESKNTPAINDIIFNNAPSTSKEIINNIMKQVDTPLLEKISGPEIELLAGSFDIVLLIDKNETGGSTKKNDPTVAQFNKYPDLKHEYRSLKVGDFTWIAKHKLNKDLELVLPYVIERKRMDDLGSSIKDGRFHEQKFRLRKCGLSNVVYLVENYGSNKHVGLPVQNLLQALANTRVQDGFKVHITDSLTNSVRFLAMMTKRLAIRYKDKNLKGSNEASNAILMTFEYFNKASAKTKPLNVTEVFIKLLLQLKGLSVEKALAITAKYSSPRSLITAYQKCDRSEGEQLLTNLKYGNRIVGSVVSKAIYHIFHNMYYDVA